MTYGHFTERSAYAELVCEDVDGGGLLVFVKQARGSEDGEARITLSANQVSALRTWLATDRDADTCACPELHPGMEHETWTDALARSEPGDIPLHLETQAEREARTADLVPDPDENRIVAYRSFGGRVLRCLDHLPESGLPGSDLYPVTSEDLPEGGICTFPDCGAVVASPHYAPVSDDLTFSKPAYLAWRDRIRRAHGS
jgi:hypothetical protein